jgi:Flp pilus assembly protein TadB
MYVCTVDVGEFLSMCAVTVHAVGFSKHTRKKKGKQRERERMKERKKERKREKVKRKKERRMKEREETYIYIKGRKEERKEGRKGKLKIYPDIFFLFRS